MCLGALRSIILANVYTNGFIAIKSYHHGTGFHALFFLLIIGPYGRRQQQDP